MTSTKVIEKQLKEDKLIKIYEHGVSKVYLIPDGTFIFYNYTSGGDAYPDVEFYVKGNWKDNKDQTFTLTFLESNSGYKDDLSPIKYGDVNGDLIQTVKVEDSKMQVFWEVSYPSLYLKTLQYDAKRIQ